MFKTNINDKIIIGGSVNNKGFLFKKIVLFILIITLFTYLGFYFYKKLSTSEEKIARESALAIYDSANLYYINTMMLNGVEEYECRFNNNGCAEIKFVSTTMPKDGYLNIYNGFVNARIDYLNTTYYICNNIVTESYKCSLNISKNITLRNIQKYYNSLSKKDDTYYCNFDRKKCDTSFETLFKLSGEILIDNEGNIEAELVADDYKYYICDSKINNENCLIELSINKIINSLKNYHNKNVKDKKYNGYKCELDDCDELEYNTLKKPSGSISIDKKGKITGNLIYGDENYYICNGKIENEECK